jgi:hypothetical protein
MLAPWALAGTFFRRSEFADTIDLHLAPSLGRIRSDCQEDIRLELAEGAEFIVEIDDACGRFIWFSSDGFSVVWTFGDQFVHNGYAVSIASLCNLGAPVSDAPRWGRCGEPMYSMGLAVPKRPSANTSIVAGRIEVGAGLCMPVDIFPEIDILVDF